jgi:hypothetical protein
MYANYGTKLLPLPLLVRISPRTSPAVIRRVTKSGAQSGASDDLGNATVVALISGTLVCVTELALAWGPTPSAS